MFKKLKQKIEEQDNVDIKIELSASNMSSGSLLSLSGSESSPARTSSQESLAVLSTVGQIPVKGNEQQILRSENLSHGVLSSPLVKSIEVDKDQVITKVNAVTPKSNFQKDGHQHLEIKKAENKESNRFQALVKENSVLQAIIEELQTKLNRMITNQETNEELEGFQNQEIAKVKHLLLLSQQSLVKKEEEERKLEEKLSIASSRLQELESEVCKTKEELISVKTLQKEKHHLELEVDRLKQESLKNSTILDEKDNELTHLRERVTILEKRVEDSELEGNDEKVQALLLERKKMEAKLEESHLHMKEIKTTWSEKINNLETQIFHLNKKMAEDSEECNRSEKELDELSKEAQKLRESNWKLEEQIQDNINDLEKLRKDKDDIQKGWAEKLKDSENDFKEKIAELESQISDLTKDYVKEKQELQGRLAELVSSQTENVEKEIENERQITEMENENRRLKSERSKDEKELLKLSKALESATSNLDTAEKKLQKLEPECSNLALETQKCQIKLNQLQDQLQGAITERDSLMMRNAELSQILKLKEQELNEEKGVKEREIEGFESRLLSVKSENEDLIAKVTEFEKGMIDQAARKNMTEEQSALISSLEEQLSDRNKTIKLQQKRLNDMKKTLQRELKMQTTSSDLNQEALFFGETIPSPNTLPISSDTNLLQTPKMHGLKSNGRVAEDKDTVTYDEVNFHYLRHVILKFMTSPEYEAQHLIRAVSVLLQYNQEEEKFIRDTLDWKMSWFGSKPQQSREEKRPKAPLLSTISR